MGVNKTVFCPSDFQWGATRPVLWAVLNTSVSTLDALCQDLQQYLRLSQVGGVKAFREPRIDRREELVGLGALPLLLPQPRHAHRHAQFPGLGLLAAGHSERLMKTRFRLCHARGTTDHTPRAAPRGHLRDTPLQKQLPCEPIDLCLVEMLPSLVHQYQRLRQSLQACVNTSAASVRLGELAQKIRLAERCPRGAIGGQALADLGNTLLCLSLFGQRQAPQDGPLRQPIGEPSLGSEGPQGFGVCLRDLELAAGLMEVGRPGQRHREAMGVRHTLSPGQHLTTTLGAWSG